MRPRGGVVGQPETRVNLRNNDLAIRWTKLVDFVGEEGSGIKAVRANFNFPAGIARNQLIRVDGLLEFLGISGDAHEAKADGDDVVREGGHFLGVVEAEFALLVEGGV